MFAGIGLRTALTPFLNHSGKRPRCEDQQHHARRIPSGEDDQGVEGWSSGIARQRGGHSHQHTERPDDAPQVGHQAGHVAVILLRGKPRPLGRGD